MAQHKGRHAMRRGRRRTPRSTLVAAPLAVVLTGVAVGVGVQGAGIPGIDPPGTEDNTRVMGVDAPEAGSQKSRDPVVSRGGRRTTAARTLQARRSTTESSSPADKAMRPRAVGRALRGADETQWTTTALDIWSRPDERADQLGVLDAGVKVRITGRSLLGRDEIALDGRSRWVTSGYLSDTKPTTPTLGGQCGNGTTVPAGVSPNIRAIHQAVCANFPEIVTYGTLRGDGEHAQGIAMDIMVAGSRGWEVAKFIRAYSSQLGVNYVIHARRIWSVQRSSEGWRSMADRGSITANHYDHVHVTTF